MPRGWAAEANPSPQLTPVALQGVLNEATALATSLFPDQLDPTRAYVGPETRWINPGYQLSQIKGKTSEQLRAFVLSGSVPALGLEVSDPPAGYERRVLDFRRKVAQKVYGTDYVSFVNDFVEHSTEQLRRMGRAPTLGEKWIIHSGEAIDFALSVLAAVAGYRAVKNTRARMASAEDVEVARRRALPSANATADYLRSSYAAARQLQEHLAIAFREAAHELVNKGYFAQVIDGQWVVTLGPKMVEVLEAEGTYGRAEPYAVIGRPTAQVIPFSSSRRPMSPGGPPASVGGGGVSSGGSGNGSSLYPPTIEAWFREPERRGTRVTFRDFESLRRFLESPQLRSAWGVEASSAKEIKMSRLYGKGLDYRGRMPGSDVPFQLYIRETFGRSSDAARAHERAGGILQQALVLGRASDCVVWFKTVYPDGYIDLHSLEERGEAALLEMRRRFEKGFAGDPEARRRNAPPPRSFSGAKAPPNFVVAMVSTLESTFFRSRHSDLIQELERIGASGNHAEELGQILPILEKAAAYESLVYHPAKDLELLSGKAAKLLSMALQIVAAKERVLLPAMVDLEASALKAEFSAMFETLPKLEVMLHRAGFEEVDMEDFLKRSTTSEKRSPLLLKQQNGARVLVTDDQWNRWEGKGPLLDPLTETFLESVSKMALQEAGRAGAEILSRAVRVFIKNSGEASVFALRGPFDLTLVREFNAATGIVQLLTFRGPDLVRTDRIHPSEISLREIRRQRKLSREDREFKLSEGEYRELFGLAHVEKEQLPADANMELSRLLNFLYLNFLGNPPVSTPRELERNWLREMLPLRFEASTVATDDVWERKQLFSFSTVAPVTYEGSLEGFRTRLRKAPGFRDVVLEEMQGQPTLLAPGVVRDFVKNISGVHAAILELEPDLAFASSEVLDTMGAVILERDFGPLEVESRFREESLLSPYSGKRYRIVQIFAVPGRAEVWEAVVTLQRGAKEARCDIQTLVFPDPEEPHDSSLTRVESFNISL